MKKLLLVAAALGLAPMSAMAVDGTISITGEVKASTCLINTPAGGNIAVVLPQVSTTALPALGATAGNKLFTISLTGCGSLTKATTYFEQGANIDATTGYLKNTITSGGAGNVLVRLVNDDLTTEIKLNQGAGAQASKTFDIAAGKATLNYYAQYYATAQATPGQVSTSVQYTMQYQ
ncbi:type 1 fimbrial protein [Lysobacter sp. MMG2]|uniref:fimbrial protein n=1 Tax=Lysobacter sp. MMG2 TaxID=2801338 RepID=UPI001C218056|nr:fimbrial protein [Lysobacter sp. MMG2]MBU8977296.1 type 1 fimbrial protein [Lysobacter sp. MMG2]